MVKPSSFFLVMAVLFFLPAVSSAQSMCNPACSIQGTVRSSDNRSTVADIRVDLTLTQDPSQLVMMGHTDGGGNFTFQPLNAGYYTVTVADPNYETTSAQVNLTMGSRSGVLVYTKPVTPEASAPVGPSISAHELSMPQKAREAAQAGRRKLYGDRDAQESLADFDRALQIAPGYYEVFYERSMANWQLGHFADAEAGLKKALEMSGQKFGQADVALGAILNDQQKFADAEAYLHHAVDMQSNSWMAQFQLGRALLGLNRLEEAEKSASQAKSLKPDHAAIYSLLANIHSKMHNRQALIADLTEYIKIDPDSPAGMKAKQWREDVQRSLGESQPAESKPKP
ncbi:MAG: tetratricopeptide repeat protein [Candidatus Acidiferrales bacterium]